MFLFLMVPVRGGFLFLWVLGMGYVILLWHSLSLPYNYFVTSKIDNKRVDFDFDMVNFPFLDGDVPRRPCVVYSLYPNYDPAI